jgi:hypothetical protein
MDRILDAGKGAPQLMAEYSEKLILAMVGGDELFHLRPRCYGLFGFNAVNGCALVVKKLGSPMPDDREALLRT